MSYKPPPAIKGKDVDGNEIIAFLGSLGLVGDEVGISTKQIRSIHLEPFQLVVEWLLLDGERQRFRDPDNPEDIATMRVAYRVKWDQREGGGAE